MTGTLRDMSGTVPRRPEGDGQGHTPLGVSLSVPLTESPPLIALDRATACVWPHSATDARLHLRIVAGDLSAAQRAYLADRRGYATILDPTGSGDARLFWQGHGRAEGWADAAEIGREFAKLDCETGAMFRTVRGQVRA